MVPWWRELGPSRAWRERAESAYAEPALPDTGLLGGSHEPRP
jgi:hypothetical protein